MRQLRVKLGWGILKGGRNISGTHLKKSRHQASPREGQTGNFSPPEDGLYFVGVGIPRVVIPEKPNLSTVPSGLRCKIEVAFASHLA